MLTVLFWQQAIMLAVMKKLTYDDEYNFENEVSVVLYGCARYCTRLLGGHERLFRTYFSLTMMSFSGGG